MAPEIRFNSFGIPYIVEFANITFRSNSRARSSRTASDPAGASHTSKAGSSIHKSSFDSQSTVRIRPVSSRLSWESDWTFASVSSHASAAPAPTTHKSKGKPSMKKETMSMPAAPPPLPPKPAYTPPYTPTCSESDFRASTSTLVPEPKITIESEIEGEGEGLLIRFASQIAQPPQKLSAPRLARLQYRIAKAVMAVGMHTATPGDYGSPAVSGRSSVTTDPRMSIGSIYSEDVEHEGLPGSLFRGTYGQVMSALEAAGLATIPCMESSMQHATYLGVLLVARPNTYGGAEFRKLSLWA